MATNPSRPGKKAATDKALLDHLEKMRERSGLTGRVVLEMQARKRGMLMREALPWEESSSHATVRDAIQAQMRGK